MKKLGFATVIGSGLVAAVFGLAAPASAVAPGDGTQVLDMIQETKVGIDQLARGHPPEGERTDGRHERPAGPLT